MTTVSDDDAPLQIYWTHYIFIVCSFLVSSDTDNVFRCEFYFSESLTAPAICSEKVCGNALLSDIVVSFQGNISDWNCNSGVVIYKHISQEIICWRKSRFYLVDETSVTNFDIN